MAKGISVSVASDTREFASGVKRGMVEPLVSAEETLGKLAEAGDAAGGKLEASFKAEQAATARLQQDIDQLNVHVREGSQRSSQAMATSYDAAAKRTEEGLDEAKQAATQNAVSTAASFNGSFDSIAGGVQGLVSEFAVGFGPAGVLAGTVAAAGIGLVTTAVDNATAATQLDQQAVADLATQYIEAGSKGKRSFDDVHASIEAMATDTDGSAIITLQDAWTDAQKAGANYTDVVRAIATSSPADIDRARAAVEQLRQAHVDAATADNAESRTSGQAQARRAAAAEHLEQALGKAKNQAVAAARAQDLAAAAGISKFQQKADLISQLQGAYHDAAGSVDDYLNKEKTTLNVDKYVHAMEQKRKALKKYEDELLSSKLSPEARSFLDHQGADAAEAMMAGYAKASPKQRAQLNAIWSTAGKSNAQSYGDALGADISRIKTPAPQITQPVVPAPDSSRLDAFLRQPKVARIIIEGYTRTGQRVL